MSDHLYPQKIDSVLLKKYSKSGPRYTSYPTAPVFHEGVGPQDYLEYLQKDESTSEISLYFHFPFCPEHCNFCGCSVVITKKLDVVEDYLHHLFIEIDLLSPYLRNRKVRQLQWGGGSPSYLNPEQIRRVAKKIRESFNFAKNAELGIELHPNYTTTELLLACKEAGFNRLSLGIQDFDPQIQKEINRIQSFEKVHALVEEIRSQFHFESLNLDLIYGLPGQTEEKFASTIDKVILLNPDRVALFHYAHVPWIKPNQRILDEARIPSSDEKMQIFLNTIDQFCRQGLEFIGLDHFAKPQDPLAMAYRSHTMHRNFMGYTTHDGLGLYGLGLTSIGNTKDAFFQNHKRLSTWKNHLLEKKFPLHRGYFLTLDDRIRQDVIMRIMNQNGFSFDVISKKWEIDFFSYFALEMQSLSELISDGFIVVNAQELKLTILGRFFVRNVAMMFDSFLQKQRQEKNLFSKTV